VEEVRRQYGLSRVVKLASNENPLGPAPAALAAIRKYSGDLHAYPQGGLLLREALAERYGVAVDNVIAGSGSDSIIGNIVRAFLCDDDEILTTEAAFIGFQVLAKSRGVAYKTVPYRNWRYDLEALAAAVTDRTKIIYLANPNNPTGTIFTREEFELFYRRVPERALIILDEAYFEYARHNPLYPDSMAYRHDNVITLRTFSKVYGLAGARIGYGFAHENLIRHLLKVKLPFEPGTLAEVAGIAALDEQTFVNRSLESNDVGLRFLERELSGRDFETVPSEANFIMLVFPRADIASGFTQGLLEQGVIVRPLASFGLPQCVRISVGTAEENEFCIECIDKVMARMPELRDGLAAASS
jgi:histidinol-phosphate aminotransferase